MPWFMADPTPLEWALQLILGFAVSMAAVEWMNRRKK